MEVTPAGGNLVAKEHSSSVESSSSEEKKVVDGRQVIQKSSSFQSEELSKVVESSQSVVQSSTRVVQSSVSQVSSSQRLVSSSSTSSTLDATQTTLDANGNATITDSAQQLQAPSYESDGPQEALIKEHIDHLTHQESSSGAAGEGRPSSPEPVAAAEAEETGAADSQASPEIQQESIKNTLKEIISEIEEAVVQEVADDRGTQQEEASTKRPTLEKQTSTSTLDEAFCSTLSEQTGVSLSPDLFKVSDVRPLSMPTADLLRLLQSVKIAQELNQVLKDGEGKPVQEPQQTHEMMWIPILSYSIFINILKSSLTTR